MLPGLSVFPAVVCLPLPLWSRIPLLAALFLPSIPVRLSIRGIASQCDPAVRGAAPPMDQKLRLFFLRSSRGKRTETWRPNDFSAGPTRKFGASPQVAADPVHDRLIVNSGGACVRRKLIRSICSRNSLPSCPLFTRVINDY